DVTTRVVLGYAAPAAPALGGRQESGDVAPTERGLTAVDPGRTHDLGAGGPRPRRARGPGRAGQEPARSGRRGLPHRRGPRRRSPVRGGSGPPDSPVQCRRCGRLGSPPWGRPASPVRGSGPG